MARVAWEKVLPGIDVIYSTLEQPNNCTDLDDDVAALRMASGYGIDIAWDNENLTFNLRLFFETFHNNLVEAQAKSTDKVIDVVSQWFLDYSTETTTTPDPHRLTSATRETYRRVQYAA